MPALGAVGVFLFWGLSGLPPFGHYHGRYGHLINGIALPQRHATNAVTAVVFDYRGFDTLGEEFILFTAVLGAPDVALSMLVVGTVGYPLILLVAIARARGRR